MLSKILMWIMIEFCSKRRIVVFIMLLGVSSVLIIVADNKLSSPNHNHKEVVSKTTSTESNKEPAEKCSDKENFTVMIECSPCSSLHLHQNVSFCLETGYYDKIRCEKSRKEVFRSCPQVGWIEERKFWTFETITFFVGLIAYGIVFFRQRMLDQLLTDKVNKQIANGV